MPELICLFGGTFDPVHHGHLQPLRELQAQLGCEQVRILPAAIPPHRPPPVASTGQRLAMLRLALKDYPGLLLDARELERDGPSYTVVTLQGLRTEYPDAALCLIMGSDAFAGLPTWYHWQDLFGLCHIIVVERPDEPAASGQEWARHRLINDADQLRTARAGFVLPVRLTLLDISATRIRQRLAAGQDVQGMLPARVLEYIQAHGIYL
jgi:nicotinate-nucleotide adenylyltransferase